MINKCKIHILLLVVLMAQSCTSTAPPAKNKVETIIELNGKYLVDNIYFPQDTLLLNKFKPSDSTTMKKLLVEFKNDSIFLSSYNFGPWYGKWFCSFRQGSAKFGNNKLSITAEISSQQCLNEKPTHRIDYRLTEITNNSLTFVKTMDTTDCKRSFQVDKYLERNKTGIELR